MEKKIFKGFIYGRGGHLGHVTRTIWTNFRSRGVSIWNLGLIGPVVSGELFENVGRTDVKTGGQTDAGVTGILLAHPWAFGSGELIKWIIINVIFGVHIKSQWSYIDIKGTHYVIINSKVMIERYNDEYKIMIIYFLVYLIACWILFILLSSGCMLCCKNHQLNDEWN